MIVYLSSFLSNTANRVAGRFSPLPHHPGCGSAKAMSPTPLDSAPPKAVYAGFQQRTQRRALVAWGALKGALKGRPFL